MDAVRGLLDGGTTAHILRNNVARDLLAAKLIVNITQSQPNNNVIHFGRSSHPEPVTSIFQGPPHIGEILGVDTMDANFLISEIAFTKQRDTYIVKSNLDVLIIKQGAIIIRGTRNPNATPGTNETLYQIKLSDLLRPLNIHPQDREVNNYLAKLTAIPVLDQPKSIQNFVEAEWPVGRSEGEATYPVVFPPLNKPSTLPSDPTTSNHSFPVITSLTTDVKDTRDDGLGEQNFVEAEWPVGRSEGEATYPVVFPPLNKPSTQSPNPTTTHQPVSATSTSHTTQSSANAVTTYSKSQYVATRAAIRNCNNINARSIAKTLEVGGWHDPPDIPPSLLRAISNQHDNVPQMMALSVRTRGAGSGIPPSTAPFEVTYADVMGKWTVDTTGATYKLFVTDGFSLFSNLYALDDKTAGADAIIQWDKFAHQCGYAVHTILFDHASEVSDP